MLRSRAKFGIISTRESQAEVFEINQPQSITSFSWRPVFVQKRRRFHKQIQGDGLSVLRFSLLECFESVHGSAC